MDNGECPVEFELHKVCRVLPDKEAERDGDLRVVDGSGEDYLYPAGYFILVELPPKTSRALSASFTTPSS